MTSAPIADAAKLSAVYQTQLYPELCTFGVHLAQRDPGDYAAVADWMRAFLVDFEDLLLPVDGVAITISNWGTVGFTGWHQVYSEDDSAAVYGAGGQLPHQLQCVGTYVNDNELTVPVGRRRNRSYVGPMSDNTIDNSQGRIGTTLQATALTAWDNLNTAMHTIGGVIGGPMDGLLVVSEAAGSCFDATRVKVGQKYDVHRSRAQNTPEDYSAVTL